ncbi:unnamed protein product, partial [Allacma fusca]
NLGTSDV